MKIGLVAGLSLCFGFLGSSASMGASDLGAQASDVVEIRDLDYHGGSDADPAQRLDLYLPADDTSAALLVWFPGGNWTRVDRAAYAEAGRALAARGLGLAVAGYRSSTVRHPMHAMDAARALAFVRNYMLLTGREPGDLFLGGQDAGAHLAALLALNERFLAEHGLESADLRGVVGLSGTYRVDPAGRERAEVFGIDPLTRIDASPLHHVSAAAPPMLLFYAASDLPGRAEEAQALSAQLIRVGRMPVAREVAQRSFSSLWVELGRDGDPTTTAILDFVARHRLGAPTPLPTSTPLPPPTPTASVGLALAPGRPLTGPGSAAGLPFEQVRVERVEQGKLSWWQLLPEGEVLTLPGSALRLLVFVPAAAPADPSQPEPYLGWLEHLARAGNLVILPDYAAPGLSPQDWTLRVRQIAQAALDQALEAEGGLPIDAEGMTWVGHGEGAVLALNAAARWFEDGLPAPRAILTAMPRAPQGLLDAGGLRGLPTDLRMLLLAAASDPQRDPSLELEIWARLERVPLDWRDRLLLLDDRHGAPPLEAGFELAYTDGPYGRADTQDWRGTWKWLDALMACAFEGQLCRHALGGGTEQLSLGSWSDGRAVTPARRINPPRVIRFEAWLPFVLRRPSVSP